MRFLVIFISLLFFTHTEASNFNPKFNSTDSASLGHTDISSSGPANKALDKKEGGFAVFSIDVRGTLSEAVSIIDWLEDVEEFKDDFIISSIYNQYDQLIKLIPESSWDLNGSINIEFMRLHFAGNKLGYLSIGAYNRAVFGAKVRFPNKEHIKIINDYVDIGSKTNIFIGRGFNDLGIELEYGRSVKISNIDFGVGIGNRIYQRINIPKYIVSFNNELKGGDDILVPEFNYEKGWGFGIDLFTSMDLNDPYVDFRCSLEARNISLVIYDNYKKRDTIIFGVGGSIAPLRVFNIDKFRIMIDFETYENAKVSSGIGMYWKLGNQRFHFTPSIGGVFGGRNIFGDAYNSFTTGFSTKVAILELAGVFEYRNKNEYDVGARVGVSW